MPGFFSVSREIFDHPVVGRDPERFRAWLWMISRACWKPTRFDVNGKIVALERGQFVTSFRQLAEELGWSRSATERFLTRLKTETMIGTETGTGKMVITICNYSNYQIACDETGTPTGTPTGTGAGQERDTKEEGNTSIRDSMRADALPEAQRGRGKGSRLAADWALPQAWGKWAMEQGMAEREVREQADRFGDYWRAKPGKDGVKLDWLATWRNWIRTALERKPSTPQPLSLAQKVLAKSGAVR